MKKLEISFLSKKKILISAIISMFLVVILVVCGIAANSQTKVVYKENVATVGNLTVGITESGSVEVGTIDQTFDLDISALTRNTTSESTDNSIGSGGFTMAINTGDTGGQQGGTDMFSQIFSFASEGQNTTTSAKGTDLVISEVCVTVGQQVQKGDVLYRLSGDSVTKLQEQLETDAAQAKADLEAEYAEGEESRLTATHTYDSSLAYGTYAQTEYNENITSLQKTVEEKQDAVDEMVKTIEQQQEEKESIAEEKATAQDMFDRMEYGLKTLDKETNTYLYIEFEQLRTQAQSTLQTLETELENLNDSLESNQTQLTTLNAELAKAKREAAKGKLTAQKNYDLRLLAYNTAQETYDIAVSYLEEAADEQEEIYTTAQEKLELFNETIQDGAIVSWYDGVVTEVGKEEDDGINTDDVMISLYDSEDITMTVSVSEEDMKKITLGGEANIYFTAYSDEIFTAKVTEISDASTDSSGNVTYSVTVTLDSENEKLGRLFQSMTGEITFITKESKEVLYVSNRAITRDGVKSYVTLLDENGKKKKAEVTTGFSDGINVEIVEGLSEGDIVLIESKVND